MNAELSFMKELAVRVHQGEHGAAQQLHEVIAPHMVRLVRRVLRSQQGNTLLDRRILIEAEKVLNASHEDLENEQLVHRVAQRLCDNLLRQRGSSPYATCRAADTVRV